VRAVGRKLKGKLRALRIPVGVTVALNALVWASGVYGGISDASKADLLTEFQIHVIAVTVAESLATAFVVTVGAWLTSRKMKRQHDGHSHTAVGDLADLSHKLDRMIELNEQILAANLAAAVKER
jgi:hypothetical protein